MIVIFPGTVLGWEEGKFHSFFFLTERKKERNGEIKRNSCNRETLISCLQHAPPSEDQTSNLGMCPNWSQTHNLFLHRMMLQTTGTPD